MKTEKVNVYVNPWFTTEMNEKECIVLYEDKTFKMFFYGEAFVELIIKNRNKIWYQWIFNVEPVNVIKYLGGNKLAKYKQNLIQQGFELMRKVEKQKVFIINQKIIEEWESLPVPATKEEIEFLFNPNINI